MNRIRFLVVLTNQLSATRTSYNLALRGPDN